MVKKGADGKSEGFLIVSAEAREVSVVFIDGPLDMSSIGKLGGIMGIPEIAGGGSKKSTGKAPKAAEKDEDDDEL